ncbi:MAG: hypothetical protein ABI700_32415 [Chloroflexota bacterium]
MESPLMILPCLSAQLELYSDHVIFRPRGVWARVSRMVEHTMPIREIESVRLLPSNARMTGVMEIKRAELKPKSLYIMFSNTHAREASAFYETLDDLLTRKDVFKVISAMESL